MEVSLGFMDLWCPGVPRAGHRSSQVLAPMAQNGMLMEFPTAQAYEWSI